MCKLQELGEKLYVDEPAGNLLQVPDVLRSLFLLDPGAHGPDVVRQFLLIAWPRQSGAKKLLDLGREFLRGGGNHPRPGQGHVLPGPGFLLLIGDETGQIGRKRAGIPRWPQAEIHLIERAFCGRRGESRHKTLGQPGVVLADRQRALAIGLAGVFRRFVQQDQVKIRCSGHFPTAQLAHGQHRDLSTGDNAVAFGDMADDPLHDAVDHHLRETCKGVPHLVRRQGI